MNAWRFGAFAELVLVFGILFWCVSLASAKDASGSFSRLETLSAAPYPVPNLIFGLLVFIAIVAILIASEETLEENFRCCFSRCSCYCRFLCGVVF